MKKLLAVAALICVSFVCLTACGTKKYDAKLMNTYLDSTVWAEYNEEWTAEKDQAIIILHGLMDGALYKESVDGVKSTDGLWDGNAVNILKGFQSLMKSDEECLPTTKVRVGNMTDAAPYSANGIMKGIYDYFEGGYGDSYDVVCWQYDWRQHLDGAAVQLNRFITTHNYSKVILVGHSMGTCVISRYLAIGQEQRDKVELFIPFGGPMLGSVDAADFLFYSEKSAPSGGMMSSFVQLASLVGVDMTAMARNFATLYHLLPSQQLFSNSLYEDGVTPYKVGDTYLTAEGFVSYISGQSWAQIEESKTSKLIIRTLTEFQNKVIQEGKHVSTMVPTEYVVGTGVQTLSSFTLNAETGEINDRTTSLFGDGLVPMYSATAGLPFDAKNVHVMNGNHLEITLEKSGAFDVLDAIMARFLAGIAGTNT